MVLFGGAADDGLACPGMPSDRPAVIPGVVNSWLQTAPAWDGLPRTILLLITE